MKILNYKYTQDLSKDSIPWQIPKFNLADFNLLAGISGVEKTRILSTIFNLSQIIQKKRGLGIGEWSFEFKIGNQIYYYYHEQISVS